MAESTPGSGNNGVRPEDLADDAIALVRKWLADSTNVPEEGSAALLAGVLRDPGGLGFTMGFVDDVLRPEDPFVAANALRRLAPHAPRFLPAWMRAAIGVGGATALAMPWVVLPAARGALRRLVGHLIVSAPADAVAGSKGDKLGAAIARIKTPGIRLNINLLGEAVLGDAEADRRLAGTRALLERDDVDYVSIKVSSVAGHLDMWAFDETVDYLVERLLPLYRYAAEQSAAGNPKFINLDMEEYRDLDLTIAVFEKLLERPGLDQLVAGIVLQAYLPDSYDALRQLTEWALRRRAGGGAPIKVRIVKGANLAMERVDAALHGWPLATWPSKRATDTNYKRLLDHALTPVRASAVRIGVAGHNLFDVALAWLLAERRGLADHVEFEMLLGMAPAQAEAVRRTVGSLLLYTPVVAPQEFDVALSYLVRRLDENASAENFMSAVFELSDERMFEREQTRFLTSLKDLESAGDPAPLRVQDRRTELDAPLPSALYRPKKVEAAPVDAGDGLTEVVLGITRGSGEYEDDPYEIEVAPASVPTTYPIPSATGFVNEPDTDPSSAGNRAWVRDILSRAERSVIGIPTLDAHAVETKTQIDRVLRSVTAAQRSWGAKPAAERARMLRRVALGLAANRDRLLEVMASETGKTIAEGDVEVSEAIDFARYYAQLAEGLDGVVGAAYTPAKITVVTPPWNFPVSIPAGSVLAALAAGSGVIIKPAPQSRRSAAVLCEALWEAGISRALLSFVDPRDAPNGEGEVAQYLLSHPKIDRVLLTGSWDAARLFRDWRPDLPLLAETSGKNAIIVTPSADLDLAVGDVVRSAFGHAGQKCSAASLVILVGSVATSKRFLRQLEDAVRSLHVGPATDARTQMGPLIEEPSPKLLHGLGVLADGESWLVEPIRTGDSGTLWTPGIRTGVTEGSYFHLTEFFGPVLGVMRAPTLMDAIRMQNATPYGLTAGLHSLDREELGVWIDNVQAGNLYINRGITGAVVQRQPFGGWKRSSVGPGTKAGGPNQLMALVDWQPKPHEPSETLHLRGLSAPVRTFIETCQPAIDYARFEELRRGALSDALAWSDEFGVVRDVSQLGVERNYFRYLPVPVHVRLAEGADIGHLLRVVVAGLVARSAVTVSVAEEVARPLRHALAAEGIVAVTEDDATWLARLPALAPPRIRLLGGDRSAVANAVNGDPDIAIYAGPVTAAGRVELLPFLHEQAISVTAHRFGDPSDITEELFG